MPVELQKKPKKNPLQLNYAATSSKATPGRCDIGERHPPSGAGLVRRAAPHQLHFTVSITAA